MTRFAPRLVFFGLALLVAGVALEITFRSFDIRGHFEDPVLRQAGRVVRPGASHSLDSQVQHVPGGRFEVEYETNPRGYFDGRNALAYELNRGGFRGRDIEPPADDSAIRVAVLGDEVAFGYGVKLEDTFAVRMERQLTRQLGRPVEVVNVSRADWNTRDEIRYLAQSGERLAPDVVLVVYALDDAGFSVSADFWSRFRSLYEPSGIVRHSYVASYLHATVAREILGPLYARSLVRSALEESHKAKRNLALLAAGRRLARDLGAGYGVVVFPRLYKLDDYPFAKLHDRVLDFARVNEIPAIDLLPEMQGRDYDQLWTHPSDPRPNEKAHDIAANAISRFVLREGWLEQSPAVAVAGN